MAEPSDEEVVKDALGQIAALKAEIAELSKKPKSPKESKAVVLTPQQFKELRRRFELIENDYVVRGGRTREGEETTTYIMSKTSRDPLPIANFKPSKEGYTATTFDKNIRGMINEVKTIPGNLLSSEQYSNLRGKLKGYKLPSPNAAFRPNTRYTIRNPREKPCGRIYPKFDENGKVQGFIIDTKDPKIQNGRELVDNMEIDKRNAESIGAGFHVLTPEQTQYLRQQLSETHSSRDVAGRVPGTSRIAMKPNESRSEREELMNSCAWTLYPDGASTVISGRALNPKIEGLLDDFAAKKKPVTAKPETQTYTLDYKDYRKLRNGLAKKGYNLPPPINLKLDKPSNVLKRKKGRSVLCGKVMLKRNEATQELGVNIRTRNKTVLAQIEKITGKVKSAGASYTLSSSQYQELKTNLKEEGYRLPDTDGMRSDKKYKMRSPKGISCGNVRLTRNAFTGKVRQVRMQTDYPPLQNTLQKMNIQPLEVAELEKKPAEKARV